MNSLKVFLLSFALLFVVGLVIAQEEVIPIEVTEEVEEAVAEAVNLDEDVQPEDLGVSEPKLLPDNPFYFLKNWARGIQSVLTFNPVKKAELRMKFANEKLMEAKKLVQKTRDPETIKKAAENYQQEIEKIKNQVEKIKEKAAENPQVESFLDKFIHQQTLHQKLLQKLETQVPPEAFEKIEEARETHLENFQGVMLKLEDRTDKITEKLDKILEEQKGSGFKEFKNLEVLKNLEEKVPEEAKEAIKQAEENALKRLKSNLEEMSSEEQEKFKEYTEKISGEKEKQLEIMENLKAKIKEVPETPEAIELKERLEEGKTKIFEKIEEKLEKLNCPLWTSPASGFCKEGRVIVEKDPTTGCPLIPKCVVPGEVEIPEKPEKPEVCITLWDPVCGKDGKTYSNSCFAKMAGVEIDYEGKCKEKECQTDADCPQPRCGPVGTISAKCIGVKVKCVEGKCEIQAVQQPATECQQGETKKYQCPDGTLLDWCLCKDGKWVCVISPEVACPSTQTPYGEVCKNLCGDGICQEVVCMAIGCPCAETPETCPEDCK